MVQKIFEIIKANFDVCKLPNQSQDYSPTQSYLGCQVFSEIFRCVEALGARRAESLGQHVLHIVRARHVTTQGHLGGLLGAAKFTDVTFHFQA